MGLLSWIIFGALAGWVASMLAGRNERQGCLMNIAVGVIGALIGGFIVNLLTGGGFDIGFNLPSFVVAVIGSLILLALANAAQRG
jgi:uncharacterized membrane protein YeaQ/YmgE (transglycosylase-associated protein family)